jgi:hypothetical protein
MARYYEGMLWEVAHGSEVAWRPNTMAAFIDSGASVHRS